MDNEIDMSKWTRRRWEKLTDKGVRYYEATLHQDLWGGWVLTRRWGRRGTRLGRTMHVPCESYRECWQELEVVQARRQRRGYNFIDS